MLTSKLLNGSNLIFSFAGSKCTNASCVAEFLASGQSGKNNEPATSSVAMNAIEDIFKICRVAGSRLLQHNKKLQGKNLNHANVYILTVVLNILASNIEQRA